MASKTNLLGTEKPYLDISAFNHDNTFIPRHNRFSYDVFAEKQHLAMQEELAAKHNYVFVAGNAQTIMGATKRVVQIPGSVSLMGYLRKDRTGEEHEKNINATDIHDEHSNLISLNSLYCFKRIWCSFRLSCHGDETTVKGACKVNVFDNEGSFITHMPVESSHKTNQPRKSKTWKKAIKDALSPSSHQKAFQQLPSKLELHEEDDGTMKGFLSGRGGSFHGSHTVSESIQGVHDLNPCSSADELSPFCYQIIAVGVTVAILVFPVAAKFCKGLCS